MIASWSIAFLVTECFAMNVAERSAKPARKISPHPASQPIGTGPVVPTKSRTSVAQIKHEHEPLVVPEVDPVGCKAWTDKVSCGQPDLEIDCEHGSLPCSNTEVIASGPSCSGSMSLARLKGWCMMDGRRWGGGVPRAGAGPRVEWPTDQAESKSQITSRAGT